MRATLVNADPQHGGMDAVWERIDAELRKRRKTWPWLAKQLGHENRTRIYNWKTRGVPAAEYAGIAVALGESVDWVAGMAPARAASGADPSPMATRIALEFDQIKDAGAQLDAFARIIAVIARAKET